MIQARSTSLSPAELAARLKPFGQEHVLAFWDEIDDAGRERLTRQIATIDLQTVADLFAQTGPTEDWAAISRRATPPTAVRFDERAHAEKARERGQAALANGEVGVVIVAGGQGSRLGFERAKGLYPIGPVSGASLLQIHLEKALAAAHRYGKPMPVYIMTSPATHDEQVEFLVKHHRFGLGADDVVVFCQGTMPAVDATTGKLLLAGKDSLFMSPNGHGGTVAAMADGGAIEHMRRRGIKELFYFQVDNPLAPIGDAEFVGHHLLAESDMTSMAVVKQTPQDRLGNFVTVDGEQMVIEYSDFPEDVAERRNADGSLVFWAGSIAVHLFSVAFLERMLELKDAMPFHIANKKVAYVNERGEAVSPEQPNALKFERFIFDLLPHAKNPLVVEYEEREVFAGLKNAPGAERDTPEYVRQYMGDQHRRWLTAAGVTVADEVAVEISPLWALDAEGVAARTDRPRIVDVPTYFRV